MTGGRFKIETFAPGALVPSFELLNAVAAGMLEMAETSPTYFPGVIPVSDLAIFPFGLETTPQWSYLIYDGGLNEIFREAYLEQGVYVVDLINTGASYGNFVSTTPVRTFDDFKGLKMRSFGVFAKIFEEAGASIVSIPAEEMYTGLATGVIDAATWGSVDSFKDLNVQEVAKYHIEPPMSPSCMNIYFVNIDAWNELPDEFKAILHAASRQVNYRQDTLYSHRDGLARVVFEEAGVEFITLPDEAVARFLEIAWTKLEELGAADAYTGEALALIKDYMRLMGIID